MREKAVCIGGGGHAKVLIDLAKRGGAIEVVAITDADPARHGQSLLGVPIIGGDAVLPGLLEKGIRAAFIGVGAVRAGSVRRRLFEEALSLGFHMVNVIDPRASLSEEALLGKGVSVFPGAVVNAGAKIGDNVVLYSGAIVEHDAVLHDHVQVSPGAIVAGGAEVGEESFLGAGCCLLQGIRIGKGATVGAGAVVIQDVPDGATVAGVPAKPLSVSVKGG